MQVSTVLLWKNNTVIEKGIPSLKQFDTNPNVGIQLAIGGIPYSLVGATAVARVKFSLTVRQPLTIGSKILKTNVDTRLRVNDILTIDSEKVKVLSIDDVSDIGYYRVKITRAYGGTTEANHSNNSLADITLVERAASIANTEDQSIFFFNWQTADTSRPGTLDLEFEITESTGQKFSLPNPPMSITIVPDFNRG